MAVRQLDKWLSRENNRLIMISPVALQKISFKKWENCRVNSLCIWWNEWKVVTGWTWSEMENKCWIIWPMDENPADPGRHLVSAGLTIVHVEDDDGYEHGKADQEHGEQQVFAQERNGQRCRRNNLGYEHEEHGLWQQNRNTQRHLLPGIGRKVKDQNGQAGNAHARDDQVDRVEQRLPPDCHVEEDVCLDGKVDYSIDYSIATWSFALICMRRCSKLRFKSCNPDIKR